MAQIRLPTCQVWSSLHLSSCKVTAQPAGTQRWNNVDSTLIQHLDAESTLPQRCVSARQNIRIKRALDLSNLRFCICNMNSFLICLLIYCMVFYGLVNTVKVMLSPSINLHTFLGRLSQTGVPGPAVRCATYCAMAFILVTTLQPLYNTVHYNTVLDITRLKDGSQKCIDYNEKWP